MKFVDYKLVVLVIMMSVLAGCMQPTDRAYDQNVEQMYGVLTENTKNMQQVRENAKQLTLPASVTEQLMPSSSELPGVKDSSTALRFDVSVNNVSVKEFFAGLSQGSDTSIVLAPKVTGKITLKLKQVTLLEVLDAVSNLYGYHYEKTSYGYMIYPKELQTRIFMMDKLSLQRSLQTNTQVNNSSGDLTQNGGTAMNNGGGDMPSGSVNPSTVTVQASQKDTFWSDLKTTVAALIGANASAKNVKSDSPMVQMNQSTGMLVVRAYPKELQLVEQYLKTTQDILSREVIIEAEILDVILSKEYSAGIDWAALTAGATKTKATISPPTENLLNSVYKLSLSGDRNNFNYALELISTQGKVSVLSKPRVSTMNNQSAIIRVGSDDYYVTSVQSQVTSGSDSDTTTSTINLQAYFSGIALYVTPQITNDGEVHLHIHPSISKVDESNLDVLVNDKKSVLPVAQSQIRETDTVVRAKDGQVIILGGLIQTAAGSTNSGLPFSSKYGSTLGNLTSSRENTGVRSELVILLRPIIVHDGVWQTELNKTAKSAYTKKIQEEFFENAQGN